MKQTAVREVIASGSAVLGIEFGSTRIKGILIDPDAKVIAEGAYEWENELIDGLWSYSEGAIWRGLQACYASLREDVYTRVGIGISSLRAIGISAMQHGYMAFDDDWNMLVPFRTWRNTNTTEAAEKLTNLFRFNIPERWSIAHLYQAILNGEPHVGNLRHLMTLASYVHFRLTGENVTGINDASGMFPIDGASGSYRQDFMQSFAELELVRRYGWNVEELFPAPLYAGMSAGRLTARGAGLLDPSGDLNAGIPLCPPEGDGGTGMIATNSIAERTGHISAGTSIFGMLVLEKPLIGLHREIDMVVTPNGHAVGMAHANNCTTEINDWVGVFGRLAELLGVPVERSDIFELLYKEALNGEADGGGVCDFNFFSGEPIVGLEDGFPMLIRSRTGKLSLAGLMRAKLYSAVSVLKIGMDIMLIDEGVKIDRLLGHGGFFKTPLVGQQIMADMLGIPVTVADNAGEGGAWGAALLASFSVSEGNLDLEAFLTHHVFADSRTVTVEPDPDGRAGAGEYVERYKRLLVLEKMIQ